MCTCGHTNWNFSGLKQLCILIQILPHAGGGGVGGGNRWKDFKFSFCCPIDSISACMQGSEGVKTICRHSTEGVKTAHMHGSEGVKTVCRHGLEGVKNTRIHGSQKVKTTRMHGSQKVKTTRMHGSQKIKTTSVHGSQGVKTTCMHHGEGVKTTCMHGSEGEDQSLQFWQSFTWGRKKDKLWSLHTLAFSCLGSLHSSGLASLYLILWQNTANNCQQYATQLGARLLLFPHYDPVTVPLLWPRYCYDPVTVPPLWHYYCFPVMTLLLSFCCDLQLSLHYDPIIVPLLWPHYCPSVMTLLLFLSRPRCCSCYYPSTILLVITPLPYLLL